MLFEAYCGRRVPWHTEKSEEMPIEQGLDEAYKQLSEEFEKNQQAAGVLPNSREEAASKLALHKIIILMLDPDPNERISMEMALTLLQQIPA